MRSKKAALIILGSTLLLGTAYKLVSVRSNSKKEQLVALAVMTDRGLIDVRETLGAGWVIAPDTGHEEWAKFGPISDRGLMRSIAESRPGLDFVDSGDDGAGLNGLIDPGDLEAVSAAIGSDEIRLENLASAPPRSTSISLAELGAWAGSVASGNILPPPGMAGWEGPKGSETLERLRNTIAAWPSEARVGTLIARPPGFDPSSMRMKLRLEKLDFGAVGSQAALEARVGRSLDVAEGLPLVGYVSFRTQNQDGADRRLFFYCLYDLKTRGWIPAYLTSTLTAQKQLEIGIEESKAYSTELKFHALIPDGYISTSEGLVRE